MPIPGAAAAPPTAAPVLASALTYIRSNARTTSPGVASGLRWRARAMFLRTSSHQGYCYYWFAADEGDDPPVMEYIECEPGVARRWSSFTDFLSEELDGIATQAKWRSTE
ncbi:hypothetical protein [Actinokineospora sp. NPDC004072]